MFFVLFIACCVLDKCKMYFNVAPLSAGENTALIFLCRTIEKHIPSFPASLHIPLCFLFKILSWKKDKKNKCTYTLRVLCHLIAVEWRRQELQCTDCSPYTILYIRIQATTEENNAHLPAPHHMGVTATWKRQVWRECTWNFQTKWWIMPQHYWQISQNDIWQTWLKKENSPHIRVIMWNSSLLNERETDCQWKIIQAACLVFKELPWIFSLAEDIGALSTGLRDFRCSVIQYNLKTLEKLVKGLNTVPVVTHRY